MRNCSTVRVLYVEKPHHCFVSSKILQPKIYLRSFYDLLLLLRTDYSVTMTSHQGKKKMTCVIFLLYLYFTEHRKKRDVVLLYIHKFEQVPVMLNNVSDNISPRSLDSLIMNQKTGKMRNILRTGFRKH